MPFHLRQEQVVAEVDVEHVLLPALMTYDKAVVLLVHQAHGVQLGHGHILVRRLAVDRIAAGDVDALGVVGRIGDGGIVEQLVVVVHIAVVRHDLEGKVFHVHAVAFRILQHDA